MNPFSQIQRSSQQSSDGNENFSHDARKITHEILKKCNVYRNKNFSIQPTRPGVG